MRQRKWQVCAVAAAMVTGMAWAGDGVKTAPQDPQPAGEPLTVLTFLGPELFYVEDADLDITAAARDDATRADPASAAPLPTPGYELTHRIVVKTNNAAAILAVANPLNGVSVAAFEPAPGFWIVTAPTVREAVALTDALAASGQFEETYLDISHPKPLRVPNDPGYPNQWHLNNTANPVADINAEPAWAAGYTGAGITIGIVEGGFQTTHPDLAANYNSTASQTGGSSTSHATSCAGVACAVANNNQGGVGLAYGGKISKQIYGSSTQNSTAFGFRNDLNHVKSNSWGPADDGTITYLTSVERAAFETAILTGRGGKGEIFCWAAGNGGTSDRVEYDPYASNRYICPIGAIGDQDTRASYNELGSSMLVVTQSSGNVRGIYTTDSGSGYTSGFGGTSSASPLGAAAVALMLQANPNLGWRDVQHVLVNSARKCNPTNSQWVQNAYGHNINYNFGFGAIDAYTAATLAAQWRNVGPEIVVDTGVINVGAAIPDNNTTGVTKTVSVTGDVRIESFELILNATTNAVGDLRIVVTSPGGTQSILAESRVDGNDNYVNYIFTSRRSWDERSKGTWTVNISDRRVNTTATWTDYRLKIYGSAFVPGDLNCDGSVDFFDIDPLVLAITDPAAYKAAYPYCTLHNADLNNDGATDNFDIEPFIDLVTGG